MAVDAYWQSVFGTTDGEPLWPSSVAVNKHTEAGPLRDYRGIWVVVRHDSCRISAPAQLLDEATEIVARSSADSIRSGRAFEPLFAPTPVIIGPSLHAYATADTLARFETEITIDEVSVDRLADLRYACTDDDWNEGGFGNAPTRCFAAQHNKQIVAAANLTRGIVDLDDVGLVVHPSHRGKGFGRQTAALVSRIATEQYGIASYRVRRDNRASVAIQRDLGFELYCEQLAVRSAG